MGLKVHDGVRESWPMPTSAELLSAAYNDADRTIELRRRLHRHPEIGLHLPQTQATVLAALADLPIEVTTGTSTSSVVAAVPSPSANSSSRSSGKSIMEILFSSYAQSTCPRPH